LRVDWSDEALADLEELTEWAPVQAVNVFNAVLWLGRQRFPNLGRYLPEFECRYWAVPPQGILYEVEGGVLRVLRIYDARRRRRAW
jgi:ParE toxin of type II toxin-antitoxin system, parDE